MDEERLIVSLEARIRDFERNMKRAENTGTRTHTNLRRGSRLATTAMERDMLRSTTRINQALATTSTRIGAVGKAFIAGAVATGMAAITNGARQAVRGMAELDAQAKQAGVSVTDFQSLKFVADQQRIDVGALTDGLKELNLRADEFVVTGKGSAAEAFARLGYSATDLKRKLEDPTELFLDLIDRMEDLDRAGQIRVADEVFGGTGGERFVELLGQGDEGIRRLMERSRELGIVMDEETIAKAAELDRKFAEVGQRVSSLAKTIVVELAGAIEDAFSIDVDEIFGSAERAISMMGEQNYQALKDAADLTKEQQNNVEDLVGTYDALFAAINSATGPDGIRLMDVADLDVAHELAGILVDIDGEMKAFTNGETRAAEFEAGVSDLIDEAGDLISELDDIDAKRFGNVVGAIGRMAQALALAATQAADLRAALPAGDTETAITYGPQNGRGGRRGPRPTVAPLSSSVRPKLPGVDASFGSPDPSTGGGGGGGGAARQRLTDYQQEVERTREAIARLEAEAVALVAIAEGGREFGDAIEYARTKAELLYAAQQDGKELTPELRAEIDKLAMAYDAAGSAAENAAKRLEDMEDNARVGADRMSDFFLGMMNGSMDAGEALKGLLLQMIAVQLRAQMLDVAESIGGGGGFFGFIGKLLTGARATGGPVGGGGAYLVNERTPNSEVFVPSQSGGILNVPQAQAALRQSTGGGISTTPVINVPIQITNNASGAQVSAKKSADGRIDIMVAEMMEESISRGRYDKALNGRYGLRAQAKGA